MAEAACARLHHVCLVLSAGVQWQTPTSCWSLSWMLPPRLPWLQLLRIASCMQQTPPQTASTRTSSALCKRHAALLVCCSAGLLLHSGYALAPFQNKIDLAWCSMASAEAEAYDSRLLQRINAANIDVWRDA